MCKKFLLLEMTRIFSFPFVRDDHNLGNGILVTVAPNRHFGEMIQLSLGERTSKVLNGEIFMNALMKNLLWYVAFSVSTLAFAQSAYAGHCGGAHDKPKMSENAEKAPSADAIDVKKMSTEAETKGAAEKEAMEGKTDRKS